eukprot:333719_1
MVLDGSDWLSEFMEDTFGTNEIDIKQLLIAHIDAFEKANNNSSNNKSQRRLSRFILKHLCNVIKPEQIQQDCLFYLRKDRDQQEFIRGDMKLHPYSTKDINGGILMKNIVEKIVIDSNMDTPTDMFELLIANCIISHNLEIISVLHPGHSKLDSSKHHIITHSHSSQSQSQSQQQISDFDTANDTCPPMIIYYRLRGLSGEATEDEVNELKDENCLNENGDNKADDETEFKCLNIMEKCNGLKLILNAFNNLLNNSIHLIEKDPIEKQLLSLLFKTINYCCKIKINRQLLLNEKKYNTISILLPITIKLLQLSKDEDLKRIAKKK